MTTPTVKFKKFDPSSDAGCIPSYATPGSAGLDLVAAESVYLHVGERRLIKTNIAMELPEGYEGQVRPRSGLAAKQGVTVLNAPGTIDADYRGEIGVLLYNASDKPVDILQGLRIAQLVIVPVASVHIEVVEELNETVRGEGGFGSTGT